MTCNSSLKYWVNRKNPKKKKAIKINTITKNELK